MLRARAREAGLAYELLATRADLQQIVATHRESGGEADVRTLHGWRRELAGGEVLELEIPHDESRALADTVLVASSELNQHAGALFASVDTFLAGLRSAA